MKRKLAMLGMISAASLCADQPGNEKTNQQAVDHSPQSVFLSHPPYRFLTYFDALFMQPSGSNLHYAAQANSLPVISPNWRIHEVHPDYHFGFIVGVEGYFHSANSKMMLDWEHFHSLDSNKKHVPTEDMLGPFFEIGPDASAYKRAKGHGFFRFDEVNLDYGLAVNFGNRLKTDFFVGVSYAQIRQIIHAHFTSLDETTIKSIHTPSRFYGVGPQFGLDFSYRIVEGFQLVGEGIASLYVGRMKNHTTYKSASPSLIALGIAPPNKQRTDVSTRTQMVPGFESKLGVAYAYSFGQRFMIKAEIGYKTQIYLNAIQSTDIGSEVVTPPVTPDVTGVYARTFQRTLSNFALAGPYAAIDFAF